MRIIHVISGIHKAAGTSVFACELAARQAEIGHDVTILVHVLCENEYPVSDKVRIVSGSKLSTLNSQRPTVVHVHALWDPWLTKMARRFRKQGAKIVWSPHGMLTPWALKNKVVKKIIGLVGYQYWMLRGADLLHATADSEVCDIRRLWLRNPVVVAPLGVNVGCVEKVEGVEKYICFVSRVQRKKGLPNLIKAWALLPTELKRDWRIKIAGPDEDNHLVELYDLCDSLGVTYSQPAQNAKCEIKFLGPVYGAEKDDLFAKAAVSVLPTYSENFGSVVVESLAQGTPVICTKGAPWAELEGDGLGSAVDEILQRGKCGWWIDIGVEPLANALKTAMTTSSEVLEKMGRNGRALVESKYTWTSVAREMEHGYAKLLLPGKEN